jgi:hypothetical protein
MTDMDIVRYAIYPCIGVARVGNAPDDFFIGPESPGKTPTPEGGFKDAASRVKRQAARFRIFGLNGSGEPVKEVTADDGEIRWRVHLANRKAVWYQFQNAMDLGDAAIPARRRNEAIVGKDRKSLLIDPGVCAITGRDAGGELGHRFDSGEFFGKKVYLGELRTDARGRLIVLGGLGDSAPFDPRMHATTFANNDFWHDDTSDGPVRATIRVGGNEFEAEPAMAVVAPPNFGQGLSGVVTLYDLVYDVFCRSPQWPMTAPERPCFWKHVYPIFERLVRCQWVNGGVNFLFGHNSPSDLANPDLLRKLSNPAEECRANRTSLFGWFRDPGQAKEEPVKLPPFYGDGFGDLMNVGIVGLSVTPTQYEWLRQWADGNFDADPAGRPGPSRTLDEYPAEEQVEALIRANLEDCLGGPFHPGIEMTWTLRAERMWKEPFRLNVLPEGVQPQDDFGDVLQPAVAVAPGGAVDASGPGTLTRWMGVPWQTDEASCMAGYELGTYLPLPSFWAARVPNQVLSERAYSRLMDQALQSGQRLKHFDNRQEWLRFFGPSYGQRINDNVAKWWRVGIVTEKLGPADHAEHYLPERLWVETDVDEDFVKADSTWQQVLLAENATPVPGPEAVKTAAEHVEQTRAATPPGQGRRTLRRDEL